MCFPYPGLMTSLTNWGGHTTSLRWTLRQDTGRLKLSQIRWRKRHLSHTRACMSSGSCHLGSRTPQLCFNGLCNRCCQASTQPKDLIFVSVYMDDVLVFSETLGDHLKHLRLVLERIDCAGLKLKPSKCHLVRQEVEYLGHVITPNGMLPNHKLIQAIQAFTTPVNVKERRQFLGLASYYRHFVPKFAKVARPLHALTWKETPFVWTAACQTAFDRVKCLLVQTPILAYPDFSKGFVLETDASKSGLGAVLSQLQDDGRLYPIAYASRALSKAEEKRDHRARNISCRLGAEPLSSSGLWTPCHSEDRPCCRQSSLGNTESRCQACPMVGQSVWLWC